MNEQVDVTLQDQLLKILFAQGSGDGLSNIAQLLMNAATARDCATFKAIDI